MCVILVAEDKRIPDWMIRRAVEVNGDGIGVAWRDKGLVHWEKGLKIDDVLQMAKDLPLPYIAHFRLASHGMGKGLELNHPFPVDPVEKGGFPATLDMQGKTRGGVLLHNGTFKEWKAWVLDAVPRFSHPDRPVKLQSGSWSDTRGMAWLAHYYGSGIIEMIGEKAIIFSPDDLELFWGTGWVTIDGILASNSTFQHVQRQGHQQVYGACCKHQGCFRKDTDATGFCKEHRPGGPFCKAPNCDLKDVKEDGYCEFHQIGNMYGRKPAALKELPPAEHVKKQSVAGAGGDRPPSGPFRLTSLEMAEKFFTAHWISRKQLKKATREFKDKHRKKPVTVHVT